MRRKLRHLPRALTAFTSYIRTPVAKVARRRPSGNKAHCCRDDAMLANLTMRLIRVLTWFCVVLLAVLSLLPAQDMVRTGFPGRVEHVVAYAGSAAIAMAGYGARRGAAQIV